MAGAAWSRCWYGCRCHCSRAWVVHGELGDLVDDVWDGIVRIYEDDLEDVADLGKVVCYVG